MTRVLLLGFDPAAVDFSDPALPPGLDAGKIQAGLDLALQRMRERGWQTDSLMVPVDESAIGMVTDRLSATAYDCVVIGAGVRTASKALLLFEAMVNAVHKAAPGTAIAFNTRPEDSAEAAGRWVG